jgi:hypothetical protein
VLLRREDSSEPGGAPLVAPEDGYPLEVCRAGSRVDYALILFKRAHQLGWAQVNTLRMHGGTGSSRI